MKRVLLVVMMLCLSGCSTEQPTMAGAKWAQALRDPDTRVRRKAAFTLGNIGPSDPAVLPALVGGLRDADAGVRCEVILSLLKYGPGAKQVIPELSVVQQKDRDAKVRAYATKALDKLQSDR